MNSSTLALDVGEKRIGVALSNNEARLPSPLTTLTNDSGLWGRLKALIAEHRVNMIVVGLPRNLEGAETAQTAAVRAFVHDMAEHLDTPIEFQDEALSSHEAEKELISRGKKYGKDDIDSLAATLILEDYVNNHAPKRDLI